MKSDAPPPRWPLLSLAGLFLLTTLLLLPLPRLPLADDYAFLEALRSDQGWHFVLTSQGPEGSMRFWRPLAFGALLLEDRLGGFTAVHASSLLLHLALGWITWRLVRPVGTHFQALLAAGWVLLHPRGVEAAGWGSAQADLGMALAVGWGGLELLRPTPRRPLLLVLQLLALGFKETGVVLTLWGLARALWHRGSRSQLLDGLGLLALSLGWFALRAEVLGKAVGGYGTDIHWGGGLGMGLIGPPLSAALAWMVPFHLSGQLLAPLWTLPGSALGGGVVGTLLLGGFLWKGLSLGNAPDTPTLLRPATLGLLMALYLMCMLPAFGLLTGLDGSSDRYLTLPALVLAPLSVGLLGTLERGVWQGWEKVLPLGSSARRHLPARMAGLALILALALLMHARVHTFTQAAHTGARYLEGLEQHMQTRPKDVESQVLVGVPDRFQGVGVFSAGLGAALRSRGLSPQGLQVGCWIEQVDDSPGRITWSASTSGTGRPSVMLEARATGGWRLRAGALQTPGQPDPTRHARPDLERLSLTLPADTPVLAFDGERVTLISAPDVF